MTSVTYDDIWKERRLELALEGDRWYDYVRRSYYDANACIADLLAQKRSGYNGLDGLYKQFVTDAQENYVGPGARAWDTSGVTYNADQELTDVKPSMFYMPFPTEDVVMNPNVGSTSEPIHVDVRETYSYDF